MSKIHFVYATTNIINDKKYIGDHTSDDINDSYLGSGMALKEAIKKYGKKNFQRNIIKICESKQEAFDLQKYYIEKFNSLVPNGYNISPSGGSECSDGELSESTKEKIRKKKLGVPLSEHHRNKCGNGMRGKKHTEKTKNIMSSKRYGVTKSEDHKKKIGESQIGPLNHMYGKIPWNKGKIGIYSEETLLKISAGAKGRGFQKGHSHSMETREKISKAQKGNNKWLGKVHSLDSKNKMRESHLGQIPYNKGVPMSPEQKEKNRASHLGKNPFLNMPTGKCIYCGAEMKMSHLNRYHNKNCKRRI